MTPAEPPRYGGSRSPADAGRRRLILVAFLCGFLLAFAAPRVCAQVDDHNPVGVTGTFEGVITTGCAYNVLNHSTTRAIDDIVVSGSIGKYPLKMTRYYVSRDFGDSRMGPGWRHEYSWSSGQSKVEYPNGNVWDNYCEDPVGVSDWWEVAGQTFRLADGGRVIFDGYGRESQIIDPYGQTTTVTYDNVNGAWMQVTEPGGRYLYFVYTHQPPLNGALMLTRVEAHGLGDNTVTDSVNYTYASKQTGGNTIRTAMCLTRADYSDGTSATYTYESDNCPDQPTRGSIKAYPPVSTCNDVRYHGTMRRIAFDYDQGGPHGAITTERYSPSDGVKGLTVSSISPTLPSPLSGGPVIYFPTDFTETRGDTPARTFHYSALHVHRSDGGGCPETSFPPSQFLRSYTDFQGRTTWIGYDPVKWYATHVTDARGAYDGDAQHTTYYDRGPNIGEITKITHPDGTHIDYVYDDAGHYVHSISNERQKITTYTRDPTTHLVTRIEYPQDANTPASYEEFTYNNFGQVRTHHLKNGAWESFVYDNRGLLTDKYNPQSYVPTGSDPHTHYTYYTSGPWTDRVQTITLPANYPYNLQASDTYEYDRDTSVNAVPGRGLVTKITHADGNYQSFGYDIYGNKLWEENELRQRTSYTYDEYNRLLTDTNPLNKTTTYTYNPTNGGSGSSYKHTTNNPDTITSPANILTTNVYDQNFRKTSIRVAASTIWFHHDNVGNQDYITDPRGTGSGDAQFTTYTDYDNRNRKWRIREPLGRTTQFYYEDGINVTRIVRPDNTTEWKAYDALNRMTSETVQQTISIYLTTYFSYWPSGKVFWQQDPKGQASFFLYNESDQLTAIFYPDNSSQWWSYDDAHNLRWRGTVNAAANHEQQFFFYDNRNRKYGHWWWNYDNHYSDWRYFGYDAASRLTEAENGTDGWGANVISDVQRQYDAAGHLTVEQQNVIGLGIKTVNYPTYDDDGRLRRMYVSGVTDYDYTFSYDAMGRFEKIFATYGSQLFQYHYDAASNDIQRDNVYIYPAVMQIYPRDALNRMQYVDVTRNNTTLGHEGYTYDPMNRITLVDYGNGHTDSFGYYLDGELNQAQLGNFNRNLTYNLDKAGNRTSVVDTGVTKNYTPNNLNQYTTAESLGVTNGPDHEIQTYNGVTYLYINDEHLRQVSDGTNTYSLTYDALNRCMKRTLGTVTSYYIYDGEKPILEYKSGDLTHPAKNLYGKGIDEIVMRTDPTVNNGAAFYYQQDHEGSVTHLTNASGNVIESYNYDAFGAPTMYNGAGRQIASTAYNNRFLFTGREYAATCQKTYVAAFNFYEYRARAYNPELGRFMSEDPKLFDAGDYNLFRYCHNDPVDFTDPMGLEVGFGESLIPIWGSGHMAYDAFNEGHYGWAAFHTAMAISDVIPTKAGLTALGKAGVKAFARKEVAAVIGKYPNYLKVADQLGAKRFNIPMSIWNKMSEAERWTATQKFLDRAVARGGDFMLDKPIKDINSITGELRKELNYLSKKGFELSRDGSRMVRSPGFEPAIQKAGEEGARSRHIPPPESQ